MSRQETRELGSIDKDPPVSGTTLLDRNSELRQVIQCFTGATPQQPLHRGHSSPVFDGTQKEIRYSLDSRSIQSRAAESAMRPKELMQLPPLNKIEFARLLLVG